MTIRAIYEVSGIFRLSVIYTALDNNNTMKNKNDPREFIKVTEQTNPSIKDKQKRQRT